MIGAVLPLRPQLICSLLIASLSLSQALPSQAADNVATLEMAQNPNERIQGLAWKAKEVSVYKDPTDKRSMMVRLYVLFNRKHSALVIPKNPGIRTTPPKNPGEPTTFDVQLRGARTAFEVSAVDPFGKLQKEKVTIVFPNYYKFAGSTASAPTDSVGPPKKYSFSPGLGFSSISYKESLKADYAATVLTAKLSYSYQFHSSWGLGLSTYFTALPLSSNLPTATVRFVGINGRLAYQLYKSSSWSISLQTGFYFTTMLVTPEVFGFQNLMGPQLYPVARKSFGRNFIMGYLKFSPVGGGFSVMDLTNREVAGGLSYGLPIRAGNSLTMGIDIADLGLNVAGKTASSQSFSFSLGYTL